ncbi:MAG: hypothetical protein JWM91_5073, partial [Rhodospirillales bacterium]|nr:hypothetical protein [Rhodospirillales bacterium]
MGAKGPNPERAALGNHNVEANIQAYIALWRLSTLRGPCILRA